MSIGVIGRKVGMTSVFQEDGTMVPVSVVEIEPNTVTALRTADRDGYTAVQLGAGEARHITKPVAGQLKGGLPHVKHMREFRLDDISGFTIGQRLDVSLFADGEEVDVTGVSKGHGFTGTVKRHGFRRGPETHGVLFTMKTASDPSESGSAQASTTIGNRTVASSAASAG